MSLLRFTENCIKFRPNNNHYIPRMSAYHTMAVCRLVVLEQLYLNSVEKQAQHGCALFFARSFPHFFRKLRFSWLFGHKNGAAQCLYFATAPCLLKTKISTNGTQMVRIAGIIQL